MKENLVKALDTTIFGSFQVRAMSDVDEGHRNLLARFTPEDVS